MELTPIALGPNARTVLERRYLLRNEAGTPAESPESMFARVASDIAAAERVWDGDPAAWHQRFYDVMAHLWFLPNSPTLMNAGRNLQQLAACFVLPVEDSLDSIFDTLKLAAKIHQSGGGTGFSFSRLRPRGDFVQSTQGVSSGPVSFLEVYDAATERIKQGSFRRGANMGVLDVTHPDILEFIDVKRAGGISNFNISVGVTAEWMRLARRAGEYQTVNPRTGAPIRWLNAAEVLDRIVDAAWSSGDPGLVFIDRMNRERTNPTPQLGAIEATNPCGEQPLLPYEACVLGSIDVGKMIEAGRITWDRLDDVVEVAVRFLDNAIERSRYPVPEIESMHRDGNRKIGLGIMGWADLLARIGLPYDSVEAVDLASELMGRISSSADAASRRLAAERGVFANWAGSVYGAEGSNDPLRNATRTTIAPTGTISIIAGCSSGIEPLFALAYHRKVLEGTVLTEVNSDFRQAAIEAGCWSDELAEVVAAAGTVIGNPAVPSRLQELFPTAHDVAAEWHVRHQAAFQHHLDNAVSKTINLPREARREDVARIFHLAEELGCVGITVYRDGSKNWQVLNRGKPTGTDLGTLEGSAPEAREDTPIVPPVRGQSVLEVCPVCGNPSFEFAESCGKCHACGHSTC